MADETVSLLQALQSGLSRPTDSMYGLGAQTVAQTMPHLTNPYASTGSNLGVTVGAGLLSGLMAGYARHDAQQQNAQLMPLMGQLMQTSDPSERMAIAAGNPRLSPLLQALAFDDYSRKIKREDSVKTEVDKFKALDPLEQQRRVNEKLIDLSADQGVFPLDGQRYTAEDLNLINPQDLEIEQAKKLKIADDEALRGIESPNSPDYKILQDKIATERALEGDFQKRAAMFKYKEVGLKALEQAYADKAGTSSFELIRRGAQYVEPGLAVRRDDEESLERAASVLGISTQYVKNAAFGDTILPDEVRDGIMRMAQRSYDSEIADYNANRQSFLSRAREYKLKESAIVPYGEGKPFAELYPELNQKISGQAVDAVLPLPNEKREDFIKRMRSLQGGG